MVIHLNYWLLKKLPEHKLLFIDTEYYKKGYSIYTARLVSIQYALIDFEDIKKESLPKLTILTIWEYTSEKKLLKEFLPVWKSMFLGLRMPGRTIPIGYSLDVDMEILNCKYRRINLEKRSFYSLWHESRAIDLKTFGMVKTGLVDPRLGTYNSFLR